VPCTELAGVSCKEQSNRRVGPRVSLTKQDSHTLVPSFSVKSTRRRRSISASHFPQMSWTASLSLPIIFQTGQRKFCLQRSNDKTPEQENRMPAIKSRRFPDAAPSTKSKKPAAMTSVAAIMRAVAL
jgi:hypothetical protein